MTYHVSDALAAIIPGIEWYMSGEDLNRLTILTPSISKPSQADVDAWLASHNA